MARSRGQKKEPPRALADRSAAAEADGPLAQRPPDGAAQDPSLADLTEREDIADATEPGVADRDGETLESEPVAGVAALAFTIGLLAGALLIGFLWGTLGSGGDTTAQATPPRSSEQQIDTANPTVLGTEESRPSKSGQPDAETVVGQSLSEACGQVVAARGEALRAAKPAMDQWAVHVGAMNKLVVGAITLAQAKAFWASTRVAAKQKIRDFQAADDRARSLTVQCPPARLVDDQTARACALTAERQGAALDRAREAVRTWKHHVADMEMLRMGDLSPAEATRMWLASWHRGVEQLRAYRAAERNVGLGSC